MAPSSRLSTSDDEAIVPTRRVKGRVSRDTYQHGDLPNALSAAVLEIINERA